MDLKVDNNISLVFAKLEDKKDIFEMLISKDIVDFMFDKDHPAPTWQEFDEEDDFLYTGRPSKDGAYILIKYDNETIGSISYSSEFEKIHYSELDIWISSTKYLGRGIGTKTMRFLIDFINKKYGVTEFLIRPWIKNKQAIKSYEKCGFVIKDDLNILDYYSQDNYKEYGEGDYGIDDTVNMHLSLKK